MANTQIPPNIYQVRSLAFALYAKWQGMWAEANNDDYGEEAYLEDLIRYSSLDAEVHQRGDHYEYVFFPCIGDEAGYWTLYVIVASGGGYGFVDTEMAERIQRDVIRAMWQVFDTRPDMVYSLEEEWEEEKGHTIPVDKWHNTPVSE